MLHAFFPNLSLGVVIFLLNILLFIVGFIFLEFQFGVKTIYHALNEVIGTGFR
ncbi:YitT family protein [Niallia sp. NCCP-28]|uniref:YitT family protein n=1 Tax=Niallia sp. NCCP-28 TaxID=2934712 RepID=UPI00207EAFFC|nr:YitT family protein [Niallia sp. NCCP-28]GKU82231.1 hypothetical protein NCCP28_16270 [Niallia sp. NCCP-28]